MIEDVISNLMYIDELLCPIVLLNGRKNFFFVRKRKKERNFSIT